jgi:hypothetical protein
MTTYGEVTSTTPLAAMIDDSSMTTVPLTARGRLQAALPCCCAALMHTELPASEDAPLGQRSFLGDVRSCRSNRIYGALGNLLR